MELGDRNAFFNLCGALEDGEMRAGNYCDSEYQAEIGVALVEFNKTLLCKVLLFQCYHDGMTHKVPCRKVA